MDVNTMIMMIVILGLTIPMFIVIIHSCFKFWNDYKRIL
jgi:hypothetical protein